MGSFSFGAISFSSLSGFDVQALVNQVLFSAKAPVRLLEGQQLQLNAQSSALSDINSKLLSLKDAVNALNDPFGKFNSKLTASSDTSVLTATADATAAPGTHTITVNSLATTSSFSSNQLADGSTTFATGSFDLQVGAGAPVTITVDSSNNTLDGLAAEINSQDLGVTATVITDANGARLSLVSDTTGEPGDLTISNNTTGLALTEDVAGTNASLTVDGISISSTSNTVSGAISGVTLNLTVASGTDVTVTVQSDTAQSREAIDEFVASYNAVVEAINAQSGAGAPLAGNSSLRLVQEQILSAATHSITGNNGIVNLAAIGINTQADGTLSVDGNKLDGSLSANFTEVQNLLQSQSPAGVAQNFSDKLTALTGTINGPLHIALKGITNSTKNLTDQIDAFEVRLEFRQQALIEEFSRINSLLRALPSIELQIQNQLNALQQTNLFLMKVG